MPVTFKYGTSATKTNESLSVFREALALGVLRGGDKLPEAGVLGGLLTVYMEKSKDTFCLKSHNFIKNDFLTWSWEPFTLTYTHSPIRFQERN